MGIPAFIAAAFTASADATEHFCADGWNAKITGFRVFAQINALNQGSKQKIKWLEAEFQLLKDSIKANDKSKIGHQVYDMLFLLFEISTDYDLDLDSEWNIGREKKQKKYISSCPN